ncbi:MAG: hypothetical protein INR69_00060 [Mucilaginibacter polytrichastri]|nr:hypothetical protein [Mucilaginibacter polytrichastri]
MEEKDVYRELSSIRNLMERSTKFISLSGLSGALAGLYALFGSVLAQRILAAGPEDMITPLLLTALAVLVLSVGTCLWLSLRKARKKGERVWNAASKGLLTQMSIPLAAGGLFIFALLFRGETDLIAAACLIFYGLALVAGSTFTFADVKGLGILEIVLGLLAILWPQHGLFFWAAGFGLLHIVYGTMMHFKYER